jgi:hypothetical protein
MCIFIVVIIASFELALCHWTGASVLAFIRAWYHYSYRASRRICILDWHARDSVYLNHDCSLRLSVLEDGENSF